MKRLLIFSISLCILSAISASVSKYRWDNVMLQQQLELQKNITDHGAKQLWLEALANATDQGAIPTSFFLEIDRSGSQVLNSFFPKIPVESDWKIYRSAAEKKQTQWSTIFESLMKRGSWDRILALEAYERSTGGITPNEISGYEMTLFSKEAHDAYSIIFQALSRKTDYSDVGPSSQFIGCFMRASEKGTIVAYLPSIAAVKVNLLSKFQSRIYRANSSFGPTSIDLNPGQLIANQIQLRDWTTNALLIISLVFLLLSAVLFWKIIKHEQRVALERTGFLNQVVHELNTPLAALKLHTQLMTNQLKDASDHNDSLKAMESSIDRMIRLFRDITTMGNNWQSRRLSIVNAAELNTALQDVATAFLPHICLRGSFTGPIQTDLQKLMIIVNNLAQNGIRYGKNVEVTVTDDDRTWVIDVRDNGPGVEAHLAKKIFEPMFRSDSATKTVPDGLGIGLSIAKKLSIEIKVKIKILNPGRPNAHFRILGRRNPKL
jgi:signal transduction histidine kinase